jgi:hypothetical protein
MSAVPLTAITHEIAKEFFDTWLAIVKPSLHSSLDDMSPAAFAGVCLEQGSGSLRLTQDKENCCELLS